MKMSYFRTLTITSALTLGLLAGCGGGGGGGSAAFTSATSSGAVADGIVINGNVVANELDASGNIVSELGTAVTGTDGTYSITIPASYTGGPIDFVLTGDAGTTMVCDVQPSCGTTNFGAAMSGDGLSMETLVAKANSGDSLSVNITPFTTAAARRAKLATTLDATAVNNANSAISNLLGGLDILALQPLDLSDPNALSATGVTRAQITYAVLASALGKLTQTAYGSVDVTKLTTTLGYLSDSLAGDTISATSGTETTFTLQQIVDAANAQFPLGYTDETGVLLALQQAIDNSPGTITLQPNPNAGSTDIARAKALVQEIRTWGVSLTDMWNTGGTSFRETVDAAVAISGPLVAPVGDSLGTAVNAMLAVYDNALGADGTYPYDLSNLGTGTGTGTITISTSGGVATVSMDGTVNSETLNNLALSFTAPTGLVSSLEMGISGTIYTTDSGSPGVSLSITSGTANVTFPSPIDPTTAVIDISTIASAGFDLDATIEQINTVNPVSFTGSMSLNTISVGTAPYVDLIPTSISLGGSVADSSNSIHLTNISVSVSNPNAWDPTSPNPEDALHWTLSVAATVSLAGLPEANLTVTVHKTGSDGETGNGTVILSQGGETLTMYATQDSTSSSLTVTDTANASLTVTYSAPGAAGTGTVKVGSATVGNVTELANGIIKISYIDGTFETLQ